MAGLETLGTIVSMVSLGFAAIASVGQMTAARAISKRMINTGKRSGTVKIGSIMRLVTISATVLSLVFVTISIIARAILTGHGPFSSMYEFSLAFSWGILAAGLFFWWRYRITIINAVAVVLALGLLLFAGTLSSKSIPLVPALQNSLLLTAHVASAVAAYGALTIGFITAVFYMIQNDGNITWLPPGGTLENISYRSVMIGFPFMTLVIVLGALWADIAWGSYWSWDPKETASLVTWLIYAGYLHSRIVRGWRGKKTALLLILGFCAVVFTFFGNYFFNGLHTYG